MPDQPLVSTEDLMKMYNEQNPGAAPPPTPPLLDQAGVSAAGGASPALQALSKYNQFLQQQPPQGTMTDSTGQQAPATAFGRTPGGTGGNPPPQAFGGMPQAGSGITPSVGLDNGNSLPEVPGGHNLRIQNGTQIQDVGYSPNGKGGMNATVMRDANTGLTFRQGPNGQFYPAGANPSAGPGMSFDNAQTGIIQSGSEAAEAQRLGLNPDPGTLEGLRTAKLMGAAPNSPVGQQIIRGAIESYNQRSMQLGLAGMGNQNKIDLANIAMDPLKNMQLEYGKGLSALAARGATPEEISDYISNMNRAMSNASVIRGQTPMTGSPGPGVAPPPVPGIPGGGTAGPVGGGVTAQPSASGQAGGMGGPATPGGLSGPADLTDLYQQRQGMFGPEIAKALTARDKTTGKFGVDTPTLMTMMYQYDRSHPGTMERYGNQFMDALKNARGEADVNNFMHANPLTDMYYVNEPDDQAQAKNAYRDYMGSRTSPIFRLQDMIFGSQPRHVIPGSPAARKAIAAMNEADRGKGLPVRGGRAGSE